MIRQKFFVMFVFIMMCISCKDENEYISPTGIIDYNPPEKILPILSNYKFGSYQASNVAPDYVPLTLLWFSDIHGGSENLGRISCFNKVYGEYIDDVIHTGDSMCYHFDENFSFWEKAGANNFLNIVGNHDCVQSGSCNLNLVSSQKCYDLFFSKYIHTWEVNYIPGKLYWYKEYPDVKSPECTGGLRLIGLDLFHWKESLYYKDDPTSLLSIYPDGTSIDNGEQLHWFKAVLQEALEKKQSVIVAAHNPTPLISVVDCTFNTLDRSKDYGLLEEAIECIQDYINSGGEFVAWLCGHTHQDWFGNLIEYPQQTLITVGTANYTWEFQYDMMIKETNSMDRFNIISIEPYNKYIRMYRIGLCHDRHGRRIESLVYDYKNKILISNN